MAGYWQLLGEQEGKTGTWTDLMSRSPPEKSQSQNNPDRGDPPTFWAEKAAWIQQCQFLIQRKVNVKSEVWKYIDGYWCGKPTGSSFILLQIAWKNTDQVQTRNSFRHLYQHQDWIQASIYFDAAQLMMTKHALLGCYRGRISTIHRHLCFHSAGSTGSARSPHDLNGWP